MDNLRAGTVVLVLVYHVFYMFNAAGVWGGIGPFREVQYQDGFLYFIYPWFMILLFALAGAAARYALNKRSYREFIAVRTRKLLVPSTLGLFVFQWLLGYLNIVNGGGMESLTASIPAGARGIVIYLIAVVSGTGPLWFAQLLWLYSLLLVLLRKADKGDRLYSLCGKAGVGVTLAAGVLVWGGAQALNAPMITVYRFGVYFVAFLLGYYLLSQERVQEGLTQWRWPLLCAAAAMGVGFVAVYWGRNYTDYAILGSFLTNAYAWTATLAAFGCGRAWLNRETKASKWLVGKSWGLYVCHYLPVLATAIWLKGAGLPAVAVYPLTTLLGGAGALALYEILRRIPVIRFLVLGQKKKDTSFSKA